MRLDVPSPARPLTGALWTLAVPMAIGLTLPAGGGPSAKRRRALRGGLVGWGVGATVLLLAQADLLYHDYNVPRALVLLRYRAPGLPLAEAAPAWLGPDGLRLVPSALWLALTATAGVFLWRWVATSPIRKSSPATAAPPSKAALPGS